MAELEGGSGCRDLCGGRVCRDFPRGSPHQSRGLGPLQRHWLPPPPVSPTAPGGQAPQRSRRGVWLWPTALPACPPLPQRAGRSRWGSPGQQPGSRHPVPRQVRQRELGWRRVLSCPLTLTLTRSPPGEVQGCSALCAGPCPLVPGGQAQRLCSPACPLGQSGSALLVRGVRVAPSLRPLGRTLGGTGERDEAARRAALPSLPPLGLPAQRQRLPRPDWRASPEPEAQEAHDITSSACHWLGSPARRTLSPVARK